MMFEIKHRYSGEEVVKQLALYALCALVLGMAWSSALATWVQINFKGV